MPGSVWPYMLQMHEGSRKWTCKRSSFSCFTTLTSILEKNQFIRLVIKQRVIGNPNLVIENILGILIQPDRLTIGDKMYLVTFMGQGDTKLRGYNTASAKCWGNKQYLFSCVIFYIFLWHAWPAGRQGIRHDPFDTISAEMAISSSKFTNKHSDNVKTN